MPFWIGFLLKCKFNYPGSKNHDVAARSVYVPYRLDGSIMLSLNNAKISIRPYLSSDVSCIPNVFISPFGRSNYVSYSENPTSFGYADYRWLKILHLYLHGSEFSKQQPLWSHISHGGHQSRQWLCQLLIKINKTMHITPKHMVNCIKLCMLGVPHLAVIMLLYGNKKCYNRVMHLLHTDKNDFRMYLYLICNATVVWTALQTNKYLTEMCMLFFITSYSLVDKNNSQMTRCCR